MVVNRIYKFRIYPSKNQTKTLNSKLMALCKIYNELLKTKIDSSQKNRECLSRNALNGLLKSKNKKIHSQVQQNVSDRVDKAFKNFFARVKLKNKGKKTKSGFPRFKPTHRYNSLTYPQCGFRLLNNKKLYLSKIGNIKIKLHREIKGRVKTLTIKRTPTKKWYACFTCEVPKTKSFHKIPNNQIGIDVGLENFATLSNGNIIQNPRHLVQSEKKLAKVQRRLSRKRKGSKNRAKARLRVARIHEIIVNQRMDLLHKQSHTLVNSYSTIFVESLNIKSMLKNHYLAKHISDASWNKFIQMLSYRAASAGGQVTCVNPRKTSIKCSSCGREVPKSLSVRIHKCSFCGLELDRDHNAALNILYSTSGTGGIHACRDPLRGSMKQDAQGFSPG